MQQVAQWVFGANQNITLLSRSHDELQDQFSVLVRLFFIRMNSIIRLQNRAFQLALENLPDGERPEKPEDHMIPEITYEEINGLFAAFAAFKQRPDYREHFRTWYTGGDLSELPDPPEPTEAKEAQEPGDASPELEGVEVFGGDYAGTNGNASEEAVTEREAGEAAGEDPVPELRGEQDGGAHAAG